MTIPSATNGVGVPRAESTLTDAVLRTARLLLRPGPGRSLFMLTEVELGIGRPDVLLMTGSMNAVCSRAKTGPRLHNWTEARVLAAWANRDLAHGVTPAHATSVRRRLKGRGWRIHEDALRPLVSDSLLIEAKVRDWKRGIRQLSRTRHLVQRSALLVPRNSIARVDRRWLTHGSLGLIALDEGGLRWERKGRRHKVSPAANLWLSELATRAWEDAQMLSAARKPAAASRNTSKRGR